MKNILVGIVLLTMAARAADVPAAPTPEQKAAQRAASFQKALARLPAGTVKAVDVPYAEGARAGADPDSVQKLDLFVPAGAGPFPLIVCIHGGGWHGGGRENFGVDLAQAFLPHGFAVATVDYRFVQDAPWPAQIEDCDAALEWLRAHAMDYHLDPAHVGVVGHSAGAHLAALMAVTGDQAIFGHDAAAARVQAAVCWATPADLDRERGQWPKNSILYNPRDPMQKLFPGGVYNAEVARQASPASYVHAGAPPILILHGGKDDLVPLGQAQAFADNLRKAGVDVTFRIDPERGHGVMSPAATDEALRFFQRTLMPVSPPDFPR